MNNAPSVDDLKRSVKGQYRTILCRKIGSRYVVAHVNWHCFAIGVQWTVFGLIWFVGFWSFCIAKPENVSYQTAQPPT